MKIGQKIRALRKKNNMSANELAQKLNKDRATIYRYENGDIGSLPANILEPLAAALNVTPADLLMSGDSPISVYDVKEPTLTKSFAKLMGSKDEETKQLKIGQKTWIDIFFPKKTDRWLTSYEKMFNITNH